MLRTRLLVAIVLVPVVVTVIAQGGWLYVAGTLVVLVGAGNEYVQLMRAGGRAPAPLLVVLGICLFSVAPLLTPAWLNQVALAGFLLVATFWHLLQFERGAPDTAWDWAATIAGVLYIGGLGSFFFALRQLADGEWWTLVVLPAIWMSDAGAYVAGTFVAGRVPGIGRHLLAPRLSPKKTWEGLGAGVLWGVLTGGLFATFWQIAAGPGTQVGFWNGAIVGLVASLVGPIGDLAISMLKRQVGVKDTGDALAGHGGMLDRIDSWLAGGAAGYLAIMLLLR